ncbi:MAG: hypothetical protein AB8H79_09885 [Myxococcota bacterium]
MRALVRAMWTGTWVASALLGSILSAPAQAQDAPMTWPDVLDASPLIVRAKVEQGGRWGARVRVQETFRGQAPGAVLSVVGFATPLLAPPDIDNEALLDGEVVWLFLSPFDGPRAPMDLPTWEASEAKLIPGSTFITPNVFAGDVPLRDGDVRVRLMHASYPHFGAPMPVGAWESLLRHMVQVRDGTELSGAELASYRACLDEPVGAEGSTPGAETADARCLATLLLVGERSWDDRLLKWSQGASALPTGAAAALANRSAHPKGVALIRAAAVHPDPAAIAAVISDARARGPEHLGRISEAVAPLLAAGRRSTSPPAPLTLTQIRSEPNRLRFLQVLAEVGDETSHTALLGELSFLNPHGLATAIDGLEQAKSGSWVEPAFELTSQPNSERVKALLQRVEAHSPPSARGPLLKLLEVPGLRPERQRLVLSALGAVGDEATATLLRDRLTARLRPGLAWTDDEVDLIAAELDALGQISGAGAADLAFEVARRYLGVSRSVSDPEERARWRAERLGLGKRVLAVLPPGSTAAVRVVAERDGGPDLRGSTTILVEARIPEGNTPALARIVATAAGTTPGRVRLCGPDPRGKVRCASPRPPYWLPHQRLATPVVRILIAAAGLGPDRQVPGRRDALFWLLAAETSGLLRDTTTQHLVEAAWAEGLMGPVREDQVPPLVPRLPPLPKARTSR